MSLAPLAPLAPPASCPSPPPTRSRGSVLHLLLAGAMLVGLLLTPLVPGPAWSVGVPDPVPTSGTASVARPVPTAACRTIDPNLVRGVCLRYPTASGWGYT